MSGDPLQALRLQPSGVCVRSDELGRRLTRATDGTGRFPLLPDQKACMQRLMPQQVLDRTFPCKSFLLKESILGQLLLSPNQ